MIDKYFLDILEGILKTEKYRRIFIFTFVLFFFVYLYTIGNIAYSEMQKYGFVILEEWQQNIFRSRVAFVWEPIAALFIGNFSVFFSVPNIILGVILSALIAVNFSISAFSLDLPKACRIDPRKSLLSSLPSLLTGFACCAPTLMIALGSTFAGLTSILIAARPVFIPVSFLLLVTSLVWAVSKLKEVQKNYKLEI